MFGLQDQLQKNPDRFAGDKILFLHTGGIYGFIDGSMEEEIRKNNSISQLSSVISL